MQTGLRAHTSPMSAGRAYFEYPMQVDNDRLDRLERDPIDTEYLNKISIKYY